MGASLAFALFFALGQPSAEQAAEQAVIESPYHFLDDQGEPFRLRPPPPTLAALTTPDETSEEAMPLGPPIPLPRPGSLHLAGYRETAPPQLGIGIPDAVANSLILVGGAALVTKMILDIVHNHSGPARR